MKKSLITLVVLVLVAALAVTGCSRPAPVAQQSDPPAPPEQSDPVVVPETGFPDSGTPNPGVTPPPAAPQPVTPGAQTQPPSQPPSEPVAQRTDLPNFESKANRVVVTESDVTFTDGLGQTVTIAKNPQRVVGLYTSHTALWYEAGGTIVGRIKTADSDSQLPADALAAEIAIVATSSSGSKISVETVLSANPDLVILGTAMSQPNLVAPLRAANVQTIVVDYNDLYDYLKWFKVFANLNSQPQLYDAVAKPALQAALDVLRQAPTKDNPSVFCMFGGTTSLQANLSASMVGGMVDAMGAINIADSWSNPDGAERIDISLEALVTADPDFILVQCMGGEDEVRELVAATYGSNPAWNALSAVKSGKVIYLQRDLFGYKPHGRFGEAYRTMGAILYPELFGKK